MRVAVLVSLSILGGCRGSEPVGGSAGPAQTAAATTPAATVATTPTATGTATAGAPGAPAPGAAAPSPAAEPAAPPPPPPASAFTDFTEEGKLLAIVGACHDGALPDGYPADMIAEHCKAIRATQADYVERWVKRARPFFAEHVPATVPKTVVYPFSGGDLSTALTVFPDAEEITTLSLEPAGDPRTLAALERAATEPVGKSGRPSAQGKAALRRALATVQRELRFLYKVNFSNTLNMIDAMRSGALPTQLIFGLSALKVHGYELVGLRYFRLDDGGKIHYLDADDIAQAPAPGERMEDRRQMERRNRIFANSELTFRKPGGKLQVHRHIQADLSDRALATKNQAVLAYLEARGQIAAMTKAASYLLSWESFATMRGYLLDHAVWMVSDATGIAPRWGKPAGFVYETYGSFTAPHLDAGRGAAKSWRDEFAAQPRRPLAFRFGYYDKQFRNHMIIMRKP